ncbi:MAG: hydrogenase formation protein HypD [Lachnospiraceae bacterium]|nr:hydrogenase formation protein HypD [Lachnospiraceae bacterium]
MSGIEEIVGYLRDYDGPSIRLMEVCGTHTAEITRNGIPSMLSDRIRLISGPGCPVCVTVTAVIDRLITLAREENTTVLTFGDLMRVPGSGGSLASAKAEGASVDFVYAPADVLDLAEKAPEKQFVFAAVGFETTAPVYAMLLADAVARGIHNVRLVTSLKTMPEAIRYVAKNAVEPIDGFLAPGHVCAVTGCADYARLADELRIPFVVSGFGGEELLCAIYALVRMRGQALMRNLYPAVVRTDGNRRAQEAVARFFEPGDASWRGMGTIPGSGLYLREEYESFDAGGRELVEDRIPVGCRCGEVLTGSIPPSACPMFGTACTPDHPHGACMVSAEGSCCSWYTGSRRED